MSNANGSLKMKSLLYSILLSLFSLMARSQDDAVREYPYPGFERIGVFNGESKAYFDYSIRRVYIEYLDKKKFWEDVKERHSTNNSNKHDIYMLRCKERDGTLEEAIALVERWLQPEPGIETYPNLIPAVSIGEENVPNRNAVLNGIARHIRKKYSIPVFQWYSAPLEPNPALVADGWIWDSYGMAETTFRKHAMKFASLDRPVICVPWVTDPHWPQWTQYANVERLMSQEWIQFRICMEYGIATAAFAVAGKGSVNEWLDSSSKDMELLRNNIRLERIKMKATANTTLPLPSADYSARSRVITLLGSAEKPATYRESFSGFNWIRDANIFGFTDLKLSGFPQPVGFLRNLSDSDAPTQSSLIYKFDSPLPIDQVKVSLNGMAPNASNSIRIELGLDEISDDWPISKLMNRSDSLSTISISSDNNFFKDQKAFYVRILFENIASEKEAKESKISWINVEVQNKIEPNLRITEFDNNYGVYSYTDDFSSDRWKFYGELKVQHPHRGGYRNEEFWVGMIGGSSSTVNLVQKITLPEGVKGLKVGVECYADLKNLGGEVILMISPLGENPIQTVGTRDITKDVYRGNLELEISPDQIGDRRAFDVHILMRSSTGVDKPSRACASVTKLKIIAQ